MAVAVAVEFTDPEAFGRAYSDYIRQVNQSEGFDQENITTQMPGVRIYDQCGDYQLVYLYAKLGLHRFNLLQEDGVHDLTKLASNLKIVKVVIETIDEDLPTNERLRATRYLTLVIDIY